MKRVAFIYGVLSTIVCELAFKSGCHKCESRPKNAKL